MQRPETALISIGSPEFAYAALHGDPYLELLESQPEIRDWLLRESSVPDIDLNLDRVISDCNISLTLLAADEKVSFDITVQTDNPPDLTTIETLLHSMALAPKGRPRDVPEVDTDNSRNYFIPKATNKANTWAMGHIFAPPALPFSLAFMCGLCPDSNWETHSARFVVSRLTGDMFEIYSLRNGGVIVFGHHSIATKDFVFVYSAGKSIVEPGPRIRTTVRTSLVDCLICSDEGTRLCRCKYPTLPCLSAPLKSWYDVTEMFRRRLTHRVVRTEVFDGNMNRVQTSIVHRGTSLFRTNLGKESILDKVLSIVPNRATFPRSLLLNIESLPAEALQSLLESIDESAISHALLADDEMLTNEDEFDFFQAFEYQSSKPENKNLITLSGEAGSSSHFPDQDCDLDESKVSNEDLQCPQCEREFASRYNLRRHIVAVHEQVRSFSCEQCELVFKLKTHLYNHVKSVHLRDKPFRCEDCPARFSSASNLKRHKMDLHENLRPFTCANCPKTFSSRYSLLRHTKTHTKTAISVEELPV
eukprot:CAMPEP_0182445556 /NCGR_PEP_ID=MMETSP1172-20130603/3642_1 /TAXON_ID=708627 /ORGANISM="Timspurckia oligopyrenoides, Strain CCMP3278" /LENGTH=531 /DNA_ID=CAMNT_0024641351 /DNA_START=184 /DNA_END=1779 /DNA_ORIENTATION=-